MSLRRLDRSKPPPGWKWYGVTGCYTIIHTCGRNERTNTQSLEEAHEWAAEDAQPYIDDALARLVEWLRDKYGPRYRGEVRCIQAEKIAAGEAMNIADAIESGEWRNG